MKFKIEVHWENPVRKESFVLPFECDSEFTSLFLKKLSEFRCSPIAYAYTYIDNVRIGKYDLLTW